MLRAAALGAVIMLAGCDGDSAPLPDAPYPDAAPFVPGPNLVTLTIGFDEPFYIRYRDGEGPWTTPVRTQANTYELHVTDAYDVVAICGGAREFDSEMLKRTFGDGSTAFMFCYTSGSFSAPLAGEVWEVAGTMKQAGDVSFGSYDWSPFGPWSFSLDVTQGTHDLIAIGETHMLIRRGVNIAADTTLAPIDVEVDGQLLQSFPFSTNAESGVETVSGSIELETAAEVAFINGSATALRVPPAAILIPGDRVDARISASTNTTSRSVRTQFTGDDGYFVLPPKIGKIEYTYPYLQLWATWQTLPRFTELALSMESLAAPTRQGVSVSDRYLQATHTNYVSFYPMPGDFEVRFTVDLIGPYYRDFTAYDLSQANTSRYTSVHELVNRP
jgi:hypothetical protein